MEVVELLVLPELLALPKLLALPELLALPQTGGVCAGGVSSYRRRRCVHLAMFPGFRRCE